LLFGWLRLPLQRDEEQIEFGGIGFRIFFIAEQSPEKSVFSESVFFPVDGDGREDIGAGVLAEGFLVVDPPENPVAGIDRLAFRSGRFPVEVIETEQERFGVDDAVGVCFARDFVLLVPKWK
jgi:hypothetical protein